MAAGLQIFNASGQLKLDVTDRMTLYVNSYVLQTSYYDFSYFTPAWYFQPVADMVPDGKWWVEFDACWYTDSRQYPIVGTGGFSYWRQSVNPSFPTNIFTVYRM